VRLTLLDLLTMSRPCPPSVLTPTVVQGLGRIASLAEDFIEAADEDPNTLEMPAEVRRQVGAALVWVGAIVHATRAQHSRFVLRLTEDQMHLVLRGVSSVAAFQPARLADAIDLIEQVDAAFPEPYPE